MLTADRIKEYALLGEGYTVDFKASVPAKVRDLTEEVCSFANASGGYILIGIDNNSSIVGADIDNNKRSAIQGSIGEISPALHCDIYPVAVDDKVVWVVEVPSGINKPYSFGGCIYMREGANAQKIVNIEEIRELFQRSGKVYYDATPLTNFDLTGNLDTDILTEFRAEAGISAHIDNSQLLDNLQCFTPDGLPKKGAVLFFSKTPEESLFHAVTRCVRYKGITKSIIIDDKIFKGPLLKQYHQAIEWLQANLSIKYEIVGTGPRVEKWEIPMEVFKESIINMLSHRDYNELGAFNMIEMYDDRIEISNPGGLLPQVAMNFGRKSLSRNPFIFSLFMRMKMVEHVGSGIGRMRELMKDADLPLPEFDTDGFFTVTLMRTSDSTLTPDQRKILKAYTDNPKIKVAELCELLNRSKAHVYKNIRELKNLGKL